MADETVALFPQETEQLLKGDRQRMRSLSKRRAKG